MNSWVAPCVYSIAILVYRQTPYFGGLRDCADVAPAEFDASELLCGTCSPILSQVRPTNMGIVAHMHLWM